MKITNVELHTLNEKHVVSFSFKDLDSSNLFNIKNISGLAADSITPKYYSGYGGQNFYNMSLLNRQLDFRIGLNPNFRVYNTYSDLRDTLYRFISASRKSSVKILFKDNDATVAVLSGFISKFDTSLFEQTQEVTLSITSDEPMLKAAMPVVLSVPNPDASLKITVVDNESTAQHGVYLRAKFTAITASAILADPTDDTWAFMIMPATSFQVDDILEISSEESNKFIQFTRSGITTQIADTIFPGSVWPVIYPGANFLQWSPANLEWEEISYYPTYWGI